MASSLFPSPAHELLFVVTNFSKLGKVIAVLEPVFILLSFLCKAPLFILAVLCFQRTTVRHFRDWYRADKLPQTEEKLQ